MENLKKNPILNLKSYGTTNTLLHYNHIYHTLSHVTPDETF